MFTSNMDETQLKGVVVQILKNSSETKLSNLVDLAKRYRFSSDTEEQKEIESVLFELLTQGIKFQKTSDSVTLDGTVDIADARKVFAYRKRVGANIRALRTAAGMTQEAMSEKSGLPQSHVCRLEKGKHAATFETIRRIAMSLGVEMSQIDPAY